VQKSRFWLFLAVCSAARVSAAEPTFDHGPVLTVIEENDLVVKTDRHYTQGIKVSYFHGDGTMPFGSDWLYDHLPTLGLDPKAGRLGYAVGQNIYTPANILTKAIQRDDRPYAGWLYVSAILQRRGWSLGDKLTEEDLALDLGVIGPWALSGEAQEWVHEIRGFKTPKGWDNQIQNEPGIRLKYSRAARVWQYDNDGFAADFTPRAGVSLGNIDTSARAGGTIRVGYNLPDDFGYHTIDSLATTSGGKSRSHAVRWGAYVFGGVEGRVVFFNETLDGGMYHTGHSVQRNWLVGDATIGFAIGANWLEFGYAHTFRSPEFRIATEHDSFGSIFAKARF
jgi:hypothetical protein